MVITEENLETRACWFKVPHAEVRNLFDNLQETQPTFQKASQINGKLPKYVVNQKTIGPISIILFQPDGHNIRIETARTPLKTPAPVYTIDCSPKLAKVIANSLQREPNRTLKLNNYRPVNFIVDGSLTKLIRY